MSSLFARRDVIVVASVSCIYGIGSREDYEAMLINLHVGQQFTREQLLEKLIALQYNRNDITFERGQFRGGADNGEKLVRRLVSNNLAAVPFKKMKTRLRRKERKRLGQSATSEDFQRQLAKRELRSLRLR